MILQNLFEIILLLLVSVGSVLLRKLVKEVEKQKLLLAAIASEFENQNQVINRNMVFVGAQLETLNGQKNELGKHITRKKGSHTKSSETEEQDL